MKFHGMGLVCNGSVTRSFLARLPSLLARLGPVKASTFRIARQIAHSLHAGQAASHYSALEPCPMIWFAIPDSSLDRTLRDFVAQTPLDKPMVVLCESARASSVPAPLAGIGARVVWLHPIPESRERLFVAEGHSAPLRVLQRLLAEDGRKLIELKPGGRPVFFAGIYFASALLLPWFAAAIESLRASGLTRAEAAAVGENLAARTLRRYVKAGDRAWKSKIAPALRHVLEQDLEPMRRINPRLAELYEKGVRAALQKFDTKLNANPVNTKLAAKPMNGPSSHPTSRP
jgi:predicted short-subunit dehydrogenase-like oxidoreductase (DUF2520 family)